MNEKMPSDSITTRQARIQPLNDVEIRKGAYVLYWMQQSQRAEHNHALEYAIREANKLNQGVLVGFGLMDDYPEANLRQETCSVRGLHQASSRSEYRRY